MPSRLRLFYSIFIAVLLLLPVLAIYRELSQRSDIWWTPLPLALSLADSRDRVEIYLHGRQLGTLLDQKRLSIADSTGSRILAAEDIRLRFNNWDRVRVERLPLVLGYSALCGAIAVLLLLVATGRLAWRGTAA